MFQFHWYGFIIGIGVLVSIQTSSWLAKRRGVNEEILWNGAWWALAGGLIGARLYHVLDLWTEVYSLDPISILYIWNGGLGIIGGLFGGFIGLLLFKRFMNYDLRFMNLLNIVFFGLPLGQAIGRIGNFINQEVYGLPTDLPWGIHVDNKPGRFHPLFAYESIWMLLGFGLMFLAEKTDKLKWIKKSYAGFYLIWYGIGRFWLDFLRPTEFVWQLKIISGITLNMAQASSLMMIILGGLLLSRFRHVNLSG